MDLHVLFRALVKTWTGSDVYRSADRSWLSFRYVQKVALAHIVPLAQGLKLVNIVKELDDEHEGPSSSLQYTVLNVGLFSTVLTLDQKAMTWMCVIMIET